MNNEKKINYVKKELENLGFEDSQIHSILQIVDDILDNDFGKSFVQKVISYTNRKFSQKYGDDEIFTDYPVPAKVLVDVKKFAYKNALVEDSYKEYCNWVIEMTELILKRKPNVYDICSEKLYKIYINRDKSDGIVEQKVNVRKRKLFEA